MGGRAKIRNGSKKKSGGGSGKHMEKTPVQGGSTRVARDFLRPVVAKKGNRETCPVKKRGGEVTRGNPGN